MIKVAASVTSHLCLGLSLCTTLYSPRLFHISLLLLVLLRCWGLSARLFVCLWSQNRIFHHYWPDWHVICCTHSISHEGKKRVNSGDSLTFLLLAPYQANLSVFKWLYTVSPEPLVIKHTIFAVCFPAPNRRKPIDFGDLFPSTTNRPNIGYSIVITQSSTHCNADCETNS